MPNPDFRQRPTTPVTVNSESVSGPVLKESVQILGMPLAREITEPEFLPYIYLTSWTIKTIGAWNVQ